MFVAAFEGSVSSIANCKQDSRSRLESSPEALRSCSLSLGIATHDSRQAMEGVSERFFLRECFVFRVSYDCGNDFEPGGGMAPVPCKTESIAYGRRPIVTGATGDDAHDFAIRYGTGLETLPGVPRGSSRR